MNMQAAGESFSHMKDTLAAGAAAASSRCQERDRLVVLDGRRAGSERAARSRHQARRWSRRAEAAHEAAERTDENPTT